MPYSAGRMLASKITSSARNASGRIYPSLTERDLNKLQSGVFCFVFVVVVVFFFLTEQGGPDRRFMLGVEKGGV